MRMRRKQLCTLDHLLLLVILLLVIEEPILTGLEAGNDRMPSRCRMLRCMLARRTVTATYVPTLRTAAEMKPPTFRGRQTFHTSIATRFRSGVNSTQTLFHFRFSFRVVCSQIISSHQQDLPDATFLCRCLSLGRFTEWQFLAYRDDQLAISHRFGHELKRFPVEFREYVHHLY